MEEKQHNIVEDKLSSDNDNVSEYIPRGQTKKAFKGLKTIEENYSKRTQPPRAAKKSEEKIDNQTTIKVGIAATAKNLTIEKVFSSDVETLFHIEKEDSSNNDIRKNKQKTNHNITKSDANYKQARTRTETQEEDKYSVFSEQSFQESKDQEVNKPKRDPYKRSAAHSLSHHDVKMKKVKKQDDLQISTEKGEKLFKGSNKETKNINKSLYQDKNITTNVDEQDDLKSNAETVSGFSQLSQSKQLSKTYERFGSLRIRYEELLDKHKVLQGMYHDVELERNELKAQNANLQRIITSQRDRRHDNDFSKK